MAELESSDIRRELRKVIPESVVKTVWLARPALFSGSSTYDLRAGLGARPRLRNRQEAHAGGGAAARLRRDGRTKSREQLGYKNRFSPGLARLFKKLSRQAFGSPSAWCAAWKGKRRPSATSS